MVKYLHEGYTFQKAKVVVQEMVDALALDLVEKCCVAGQLVLYVGYDKDSLISRELNDYTGSILKIGLDVKFLNILMVPLLFLILLLLHI